MAIEPKGIIVHSMSEYFERDALKWLSRYNKETNTFDGTPLHQYPNPIHAPDWLVYSRLSVHGFISPNGDWIAGRAVPEKAAHAGKSIFGNLSGLNSHFLGFEMLVPGVNNYSQFINKIATAGTFSSAQRETALAKCREWMATYNISSNAVVGHSEVSGDDVRGPGKGKRDPGSSFDMDAFRGDL
ncbi:N-acetylmuramoyl-L-alanine amidase [Ekhidna sp.]|uniref:N-acetylmuramoyl-L-alanine amidase n=1 Tax=Ekhidna sp. TaxID=2608089 RepID=UPI003BAA4D0A